MPCLHLVVTSIVTTWRKRPPRSRTSRTGRGPRTSNRPRRRTIAQRHSAVFATCCTDLATCIAVIQLKKPTCAGGSFRQRRTDPLRDHRPWRPRQACARGVAEVFSWFSLIESFATAIALVLPDRLVLARRRIEDVEHASSVKNEAKGWPSPRATIQTSTVRLARGAEGLQSPKLGNGLSSPREILVLDVQQDH